MVKEKISGTGNRTPSYRVKGGNVSRYTIPEYRRSRPQQLGVVDISSSRLKTGDLVPLVYAYISTLIRYIILLFFKPLLLLTRPNPYPERGIQMPRKEVKK